MHQICTLGRKHNPKLILWSHYNLCSIPPNYRILGELGKERFVPWWKGSAASAVYPFASGIINKTAELSNWCWVLAFPGSRESQLPEQTNNCGTVSVSSMPLQHVCCHASQMSHSTIDLSHHRHKPHIHILPSSYPAHVRASAENLYPCHTLSLKSLHQIRQIYPTSPYLLDLPNVLSQSELWISPACCKCPAMHFLLLALVQVPEHAMEAQESHQEVLSL